MKGASKSGRASSVMIYFCRVLSFSRQIKVDALFTNYRIQSNANNEITMGLTSEALLGALKSAAASSSSTPSFDTDEVVMKLAKKTEQALLSFEISGQTRVGHRLRVAHDVKIEVMRPADVEKLKEPLCPEPDVRYHLHRVSCLWSDFYSYISFSRLFKNYAP